MPTLTMDSNIVLKILAIQNDFEVEASLDVEKPVFYNVGQNRATFS